MSPAAPSQASLFPAPAPAPAGPVVPPAGGGLRVHRSNRVEFLAALLAHNLALFGAKDPIATEHVVVGNRGTERWLAHALSSALGIAANIAYPFPASVVRALVDGALGPLPRGRAERWSKTALKWAIADELLALPAGPLWQPLHDWMAAEPPDQPEVIDRRLLGLAARLADVFDRIQAFRPEWTARWESGLDGPDEVAAWQPALWRQLVARLGPDHHAARTLQALAALQAGPPVAPLRLQGRDLATLHLFGISSLPPIWLELLGAAGRHLSIDIYLLSPSNQFWADVRRGTLDLPSPLRLARDQLQARLEAAIPPDAPVGPGRTRPNPTLATFGRIARDFQAVLERLPEGYRDQPGEGEPFMDPVPDSAAPEGPAAPALHWLQSDILHMRHPADHKRSIEDFERRRLDPDDDSLQIHACYSSLRQVEALKDALLDLFDRHPTLQPRDVLVMCPDIATLAPLVTAVFGDGDRAASGGAPAVPHRLADRSLRELNPVSEAILQLLALSRGRLRAPEVLELLALEPVRARFGIEAGEVPVLAELVARAGARWGRDAAHRTDFDQPAEPLCTWRFAMERLALGVVLDASPVPALLWEGLRPVDLGGTSEDTARVERLLAFSTALLHHCDQLAHPRPLAGWATALDAALDDLVTASPETAFRLRQVREAVAALGAGGLDPARVVDSGAVHSALEGSFGELAGPLGQQTGAVTFCTLLPERGVPHKVVCLLGMDEGAWPRNPPALGFDPTVRKPRVGDRDPRDEDRYLLLEALMAARDHLLVFYTGRDQRSREELPPAAPIGELIDVVEASFLAPPGWDEVRGWLVVEHALQPFSARNFVPGGLIEGGGPHRLRARPWSFDPRLAHSATVLREGGGQLPVFWPQDTVLEATVDEAIELTDLVRFWSSPARWLVRQRLGLWLGEEHAAVPDREPVELDGLESWILQERLGTMLLDPALAPPDGAPSGAGPGLDLAPLRAGLWARAALPPGTLGVLGLQAAAAVMAGPAARLRPFRAGLKPVDLRLRIGAHTLSGQVPEVGEGGVTALVQGRLAGRRLLAPWLHAVALVASGRPTPLVIAPTKPAKGGELVRVLPFGGDAGAARAWLGARLDAMVAGQRQPLPFFARASWALAEKAPGRGKPPIGATHARAADLPPPLREAALTAARQHWHGSERLRGEVDDPDVRAIFGTDFPAAPHSPAEDALLDAALAFWHPFLSGMETL